MEASSDQTQAAQPFEVVRPNASAMIESMRAFGYSTQSAIADLIDNSLSANATTVWIEFFWDGASSYISVTDDGDGMSATELSDAMRLGSRSPREVRAATDLGRFGLGLKTASFSQARRLSVESKRADAIPAVRQWDLDYVAACGDWRLLTSVESATRKRLPRLADLPHGTTVLWEHLDRVVGAAGVNDDRAKARFLELAGVVEKHVAMVFHRFLGRPKAFRILIHGQSVEPWDPFLADLPATQRLAEEHLTLHGQRVVVRPFILPHHSRLTLTQHKIAAGVGGWNAQQGFYIYRNRRLLVAGDWLRLGFQKEEHCKLVRIQVDLPNSLDADWSIDVKKATARPPGPLRDDLQRIASVARQRATEIYRHRGKVIARPASQDYAFVWDRVVRRGRTFYRVNREHPLIRATRAILDHDQAESFDATLRLVEETVPTPLIALDHSQAPEAQATPFEDTPTAGVIAVMERIYISLRADGLSDAAARERISSMEPFQLFPEIVASFEGGPT